MFSFIYGIRKEKGRKRELEKIRHVILLYFQSVIILTAYFTSTHINSRTGKIVNPVERERKAAYILPWSKQKDEHLCPGTDLQTANDVRQSKVKLIWMVLFLG